LFELWNCPRGGQENQTEFESLLTLSSCLGIDWVLPRVCNKSTYTTAKMADQAGPSGAGNAAMGKSLEDTQELFNTGVACIKVRAMPDFRSAYVMRVLTAALNFISQTNALEMAADIFAQVLRARTSRYGGASLL
jgi:hypothetical protein